MVKESLAGAGTATVNTFKYLPCLYNAVEVLALGASAFSLGVVVGFYLGQLFAI